MEPPVLATVSAGYLNVLANQELAIPRGWQERKKYRAFFGGRAATHEKGIRAS